MAPGRNWSGAARRWAPLALLTLLALVARNRAEAADVEDARVEPVVYDQRLVTPVFSARRIPQTLQAPLAAAALRPAIDAVVAASPPDSCLVVLDDGRTLEDRSGERSLIPASNEKIISTWAALNLLGSTTRFRTTVRADTAPLNGVVEGNLYLVGGGDPFLTTDNWWSQYQELDGRTRTRLEDLADSVVAAGVRTVTGAVVGDETYFDAQRVGPWAERLIESRQSGPLSALAVNEGYVQWPAIFEGTFRPRVPSLDPPTDAARVFGELLTARGVTVGGPLAGVAPAAAVEVAVIDSPPLIDIVTHINSYRDNFGAEVLLKHLGRQHSGIGSTVSGAEAATTFAAQSGLPMPGVIIADGSGLSEANIVTCRFFAALLELAGEDSELVKSFSIGGRRGSLLGRWVDSPVAGQVYAKTGTLNDVSALTGVVNSVSDPETSLVFSYLVNGELVGQTDTVRGLQTPLVEALAKYPDAPALDVLAPSAPTR